MSIVPMTRVHYSCSTNKFKHRNKNNKCIKVGTLLSRCQIPFSFFNRIKNKENATLPIPNWSVFIPSQTLGGDDRRYGSTSLGMEDYACWGWWIWCLSGSRKIRAWIFVLGFTQHSLFLIVDGFWNQLIFYLFHQNVNIGFAFLPAEPFNF